MANVFETTSAIRQLAQGAFDDTLDQWGRDVILYYTPVMEVCSLCVVDPIGNKPANHWIHGGNMPAGQPGCPMCGGQGYKAIQKTDTIKLSVIRNPKYWMDIGVPIDNPDGMIQTRGYASDLPKVLLSDYMTVKDDIVQYGDARYKRHGEFVDPYRLIQNRYFMGFWKRV